MAFNTGSRLFTLTTHWPLRHTWVAYRMHNSCFEMQQSNQCILYMTSPFIDIESQLVIASVPNYSSALARLFCRMSSLQLSAKGQCGVWLTDNEYSQPFAANGMFQHMRHKWQIIAIIAKGSDMCWWVFDDASCCSSPLISPLWRQLNVSDRWFEHDLNWRLSDIYLQWSLV